METLTLASSLRNIVSGISKRLRKTIHAHGNFSLTEMHVLSYLYPGDPLSPTGLAKLVGIKTQSMSELLIRLREAGIVDKTPSEHDKRMSFITLTALGRKIVEEIRYERDEWLASAIDHTLTQQEKQVLQQAIAIMEKVRAYQ